MSEQDALDHSRAFALAGELADEFGKQMKARGSSTEAAERNAGIFYTIATAYGRLADEIRQRS